MAGYMNETKMKWLALPFDSPFKGKAASKYGVRGIPTLIILGPDGKTITANGRGDVTRHPGNAFNMWMKAHKNPGAKSDDGAQKTRKEKAVVASAKKTRKKAK